MRPILNIRFLISLVFCLGFKLGFSQSPSLNLDTNSKYVFFPKSYSEGNFYGAAQIRIGTYLTLGNFGYTNSSWIGSNALLSYTSYNGHGEGSRNEFKPMYNGGQSLILNLTFSKGELQGWHYDWNSQSAAVNFTDFNEIWTLGKEKSFILSKLGVGTSNPTHKLDVKGTVHAEEVLVDLNVEGPDYVFEENYPLQDLTSLEEYLKKNKHLPEVPSATEMQAEGIKVGEMEMLLLKKVEELTLYLIEQYKIEGAQKQKIEELEKKNTNLKATYLELLKRIEIIENKIK